MGYPTRLLTEDESIVSEFHPHWRVLILPVTWAVVIIAGIITTWSVDPGEEIFDWIVTAVLVVVGLVVVALPIVRRQFTQYVLTTERLIVRQGIISRSGVEIPLENINDVRFSQNPFERILRFGDVTIESAGELGQSRMGDIPDPEGFQSKVYAIREERSRALNTGGGSDPASQIETLARLRDQGAITEDEFQEKKRALLDQI